MRFGLFKNRTRRPVPIVYQYWDNNPPPDIASWMRTWEGVEPGFKLEQFDDGTARKFIAERIGTEAESAYLECRAPAMKSDFFRYCALYATGGIYVDAGTSYRGGLADLYAKGNRGLLLRRTKGPGVQLINGFMIAKRPEDSLMGFAIKSAIANIRNRKSQSVWDVTGPGILRRAYISELQSELFSGFEILDMHSALVRSVFVLLRREHKIGPLDWRQMRQAGETIFVDKTLVRDACDDPAPAVAPALGENVRYSRRRALGAAGKLAFLHIPKSGGVSVEQVLKKHFPREKIAPYYFPHEYAKIESSVDPCSFGLIIGHFDYDLVKRLDRTFVRAVLFRDPLQLVVSLYNHAASRPAHRLHTAISAGDLPFEKFCRTVSGASNILSKYLLGRSTYFEYVADGVNEKVIEKGVAAARRHLANFDCIGMLDEMDQFGRMLSFTAGIDMSEIPRLNSSRSKRVAIDELTPAERRSLVAANRLDLSIYEAVRKSYEAGDWRSDKQVLP